jgi:hypothetical protein
LLEGLVVAAFGVALEQAYSILVRRHLVVGVSLIEFSSA